MRRPRHQAVASLDGFMMKRVRMAARSLRGTQGWLVVYIVGSIPVLMFYGRAFQGGFSIIPLLCLSRSSSYWQSPYCSSF